MKGWELSIYILKFFCELCLGTFWSYITFVVYCSTFISYLLFVLSFSSYCYICDNYHLEYFTAVTN